MTPVSISSPPLRYSARPVSARTPVTVTPPSAERLDKRPGEPLEELVQGEEPVGGVRPADSGMGPDIAERPSDDAAKRRQHGTEEAAGRHPTFPAPGSGPDMVEEMAKAPHLALRRIDPARELRPCRDRAPEGVQAPDPPRDSEQRVVSAELKRPLERSPVDAAEPGRVRA